MERGLDGKLKRVLLIVFLVLVCILGAAGYAEPEPLTFVVSFGEPI